MRLKWMPSAIYQSGFASKSLFPSVEKFLEANKEPGDEEVDGVGEAAVYFRHTDNKTAGIVVLLDGGNNFVLATNNAMPNKGAFIASARAIIDRR